MFVLQTATNKPIDWPVTVEYAAAGGKIAKHTFTGYFLQLDDDQREAILARTKAAEAKAAEAKSGATGADPAAEGAEDEAAQPVVANAWKDDSVDAIMLVMTGWKDIIDHERRPIEFTRENLRAAARSPQGVGLLRGINTAIAEITTGARAKN